MKPATTANDSACDAFDESDCKARQLAALLEMTWGDAGESFRSLDENAQDYYLWACSDLAQQLVRLHEGQYDARHAAKPDLRRAS